jgi:predicted CoA-binding protein
MFPKVLSVKNWRNNIIKDVEGIREIVLATKRVAVLGIRSEKDCSRPAFYVPQYLVSAGLQVIPVSAHHLKVHTILGQRMFRRLTEIPDELDLVDVFRRSEDIPAHLDDLLAKKPRAVWFQSGIRNDEVADSLAYAGIKVVQDRCLMVDHRRYTTHEKAQLTTRIL